MMPQSVCPPWTGPAAPDCNPLVPTMATNLPTFFQSAGTTVLDELLDFELGGLEDAEEEESTEEEEEAGE